jgi:hypothetical protein
MFGLLTKVIHLKSRRKAKINKPEGDLTSLITKVIKTKSKANKPKTLEALFGRDFTFVITMVIKSCTGRFICKPDTNHLVTFWYFEDQLVKMYNPAAAEEMGDITRP